MELLLVVTLAIGALVLIERASHVRVRLMKARVRSERRKDRPRH